MELLTGKLPTETKDYQGDLTLELEVEDPENLPRYTEEAYFYLSGMLGLRL